MQKPKTLTQKILIQLLKEPATAKQLTISTRASRGSVNSTLSRLVSNKILKVVGKLEDGCREPLIYGVSNIEACEYIAKGNRYCAEDFGVRYEPKKKREINEFKNDYRSFDIDLCIRFLTGSIA